MFLSIVLYGDMRECKVDSRNLVYENADKLALCDVGKSSELVQCIEDLPEDMPAMIRELI